MLIVYLYVVK